jgi:hypothetical protein
MKVSGKGVMIIILFLVIIPVVIELVLMVVMPKDVGGNFRMVRPLFFSYGKAIPFYIFYLVIACAIMYSIGNWKKITSQK